MGTDMKLHHHIYNLVKTQYFAVRLWISSHTVSLANKLSFGLKIFHDRLTRELQIIFLLLLLIILPFNLIQSKTQFEKSKEEILRNSSPSQAHLFLAQQFFVTNQFSTAQNEAHLAGNREMLAKLQSVQSQPEQIKNNILTLQKISDQLPAFRDIYIQLAILNWKIYRPFVAQKYLQRALEIDPNNEVTKKLLSETETQ